MKLTRKQWMMLAVLVLGAFVTVLNQTLVTPALPSIMVEMSVDQSTAQWLTTGFTLVNAIMIPITAFLQDRFSTRKLFVFSMSLFAVGSAAGGRGPQLSGASGRPSRASCRRRHPHAGDHDRAYAGVPG
ncbi:MAG: MFS transporter [Adlercreutzia equolifaciens]